MGQERRTTTATTTATTTLMALVVLATAAAAQPDEAAMVAGLISSLHDPSLALPSPEAEAVVNRVRRIAPELFQGTEELARQEGFDVEAHDVTTEDGYGLTLHRLVRGDNATSTVEEEDSEGGGRPVLLVHGLFCGSDFWLMSNASHALSYQLVDRGYDVWLANFRGNPYSRRHESLSPDDDDFWKFSWDEMGRFDLPAFVLHILNATGRDSLFYVGHSMGNTAYFVMAAARPEMNSRVRLHVGLAPVVYIDHLRSPLANLLIPRVPTIARALEQTKRMQILPPSSARAAFIFLLCNSGPDSIALCHTTLSTLYGPTHPGLNASKIPFYMAHMTHGCSTRTLAHYAQNIISGHFRPWEANSVGDNNKRYGRSCPPDYPLHNVTAPSALFYSDDDFELHPKGVKRLVRELSNVVTLYRIPSRPFNHIDFVVSPYAPEFVYDKVFKLFQEH